MASDMDSKKLKVKCTYGDCMMHFPTEKDMKRHKKEAPQHDYCKKCDVDCKDWMDFTQHKVAAMAPWLNGRMKDNEDEPPQHIVCEFCGEDFKSFGGRKKHRELNHKADQDIVCPGCKMVFSRAGNFMEHIETNRCTVISRREFLENVQQKHIVAQIMKDPQKFIHGLEVNKAYALPSDMSSTVAGSDIHDVQGGGVSLLDQDSEDQKGGYEPLKADMGAIQANMADEHVLQKPQIRSVMETWPKLPSRSPSELTPSMRSMSISSTAASLPGTEISASEFAINITGRHSKAAAYTKQQFISATPQPSIDGYDDVEVSSVASTVLPCRKESTTVWASGNTSQTLFPNAGPTPMAGDWEALRQHKENELLKHDTNNLFTSRFWDKGSAEYDVSIFFNSLIGKYCCPFPDCGDSTYDESSDLEGHLKNTHLKRDYRCALCLKIYDTAHGWVSHSESGGSCKVKESTMYDQLLDEVSGGFLEATHLRQPKIYKTSSTIVNRDTRDEGEASDGVMSTRFVAKFPDEK